MKDVIRHDREDAVNSNIYIAIYTVEILVVSWPIHSA